MATYPSPTLQNLTVNGTATLTDVSSPAATITGGTIDGTPIGATTPAAVHATTINSTGAATLASVSTASATLTGGTVDGVTIGGTTPEAVHATTLSASGTVSGTGFTNLLSPYSTSTTLAGTAAGNGAYLIGYQNPGSGAVARTVQKRLQEMVSVKDFGAAGDGVTDDHLAFQNAISYLVSLGGGTLRVPRGSYLVSSTVAVNANGIYLVGDGDTLGASAVINGTSNSPAIQFGNGVTQINRCGISGIWMGQATGITPTTGNVGLLVNLVGGFSLHDISIGQFPSSLYEGIEFRNVTQSMVDNVNLQNCLASGFYIHSSCNDIYCVNCRSDANSQNGYTIADSSGLYFVNCTGFNNNGSAFNISTEGSNTTGNLFFSNCVGDTSGSYNWEITQCLTGFFSNCWGSTQQSTSLNTFATGFLIDGVNVSDLTFLGASAFANNSHGINVVQGTRTSFISAQLRENGKSGSSAGINVGAQATGTLIVGGFSTLNTGYGVIISNGSVGTLIDGSYVSGNTVGSLNNLANSSSANSTVRDCIGYNPVLGSVVTPAVPASGTPVTNLSGVTVTAYLLGGTVTGISISGTSVLTATPASVRLPPGATITLTYSAAPTWTWIGD